MGLPRDPIARRFFKAGWQRLEDAQTLLANERTTGAAYLAGYAAECVLKSLVLQRTPPRRRKQVFGSFRGGQAHNFEWLRAQLRELKESPPPTPVLLALARLTTWSTDFRYQPGTIKRADADAFLAAAESVSRWAEGRL